MAKWIGVTATIIMSLSMISTWTHAFTVTISPLAQATRTRTTTKQEYLEISSGSGSGINRIRRNNSPSTGQSSVSTDSQTRLQMCICINCSRVVNCSAYHFVETKHEQPHMAEEPTFEPRDGSPTIHVNIRTVRNDEDREREVKRMWREHEAETARAEARAEAEAEASGEGEGRRLVGKEVYDMAPVTTYEYDVVACEDFVEEEGCWVRNMPEAIRLANPDFVPS